MSEVKDSYIDSEKIIGIIPIISIKSFKSKLIEGQIDDDIQRILDNSSETAKRVYSKWQNKGTENVNESDIIESTIESDNPYINMEFTDRLDIQKAVFYISDSPMCDIDNLELEKIQVVIKYKQRHSYGLITGCCKTCKRLFITNEDYDEYQPIFYKKGIEYETIKLEENNDEE